MFFVRRESSAQPLPVRVVNGYPATGTAGDSLAAVRTEATEVTSAPGWAGGFGSRVTLTVPKPDVTVQPSCGNDLTIGAERGAANRAK